MADRQVFDLLGFDSVRALTALSLYQRRFGGYGNRFGGSAYLERNGRDADVIAARNQDPLFQRGLERRGCDLNAVRVGCDVHERVVPVLVGLLRGAPVSVDLADKDDIRIGNDASR